MYCRYCGNKLLETDNFCNVCGKKVMEDNSNIFPKLKEGGQNGIIHCNNVKNKVLESSLMKFIFCMFLFCLLTVCCYSFVLPAHISLIDFVTDSRGLSAVVFDCIGGSLGELLLVMPLLYGLKKLKITNSLHRFETFFFIMCVHLICEILFGKVLYQRIFLLAAEGAIVFGIILIVVAYFKEKRF